MYLTVQCEPDPLQIWKELTFRTIIEEKKVVVWQIDYKSPFLREQYSEASLLEETLVKNILFCCSGCEGRGALNSCWVYQFTRYLYVHYMSTRQETSLIRPSVAI